MNRFDRHTWGSPPNECHSLSLKPSFNWALKVEVISWRSHRVAQPLSSMMHRSAELNLKNSNQRDVFLYNPTGVQLSGECMACRTYDSSERQAGRLRWAWGAWEWDRCIRSKREGFSMSRETKRVLFRRLDPIFQIKLRQINDESLSLRGPHEECGYSTPVISADNVNSSEQ